MVPPKTRLQADVFGDEFSERVLPRFGIPFRLFCAGRWRSRENERFCERGGLKLGNQTIWSALSSLQIDTTCHPNSTSRSSLLRTGSPPERFTLSRSKLERM